jgi:5-formyltetrahydrofolate cyclo-ligase
MTILDQKKALRNQMLFKRATFPKSIKPKYDEWICLSLWRIIAENEFKTIHCYIPMGTEIDLSPLIERLLENNIKVISPKTLPKRKLKNLVLSSLKDVENGVYGTTYPSGDIEYDGDFDMIIIPGLAFDSTNYRLGYGGGYYDNFIVNHPQAKKIGIFYPFQEVGNVPVEPHDIRLDAILINKEIVES